VETETGKVRVAETEEEKNKPKKGCKMEVRKVTEE